MCVATFCDCDQRAVYHGLWMFMDVYGCLWFIMAYRFKSLESHGIPWNPMESLSQDTSITWFKTSVVDTKFTMMSTVEASDLATLDRNAAPLAAPHIHCNSLQILQTHSFETRDSCDSSNFLDQNPKLSIRLSPRMCQTSPSVWFPQRA